MSGPRAGIERALARARGFVARHGAPLEQLRLRALFDAGAADELLARVSARQQADGAVAALGSEAGPADLRTTAAALTLLDDQRLLHDRCAERAAGWLAAQQQPDGSFAATGDVDEAARLATTAALAGQLARAEGVPLRVLEAAGAQLGERFSPERLGSADDATLAAFARFFSHFPHELSDAALQWCGRELEQRFRDGRTDAVRTACVLVRCEARALPGTRLEASELVAAILALQADDGSFGGDADPPTRVARTLDAVLALVRLS